MPFQIVLHGEYYLNKKRNTYQSLLRRSSKKSNNRFKHTQIKSQKMERMELGTNNSDDKRFVQLSIMLFNVRDFHSSHAHVPCLQKHTLSNQANSAKWGRTKLIKEECWTYG
jgi:hypothetical protein